MNGHEESPWIDKDGAHELVTVRCRECGRQFFPPQRLGCEGCGAAGDALDRVPVPAVGRVRNVVAVHVHPTADVPFYVADVELDAVAIEVQAVVSPDVGVGATVVGQVLSAGDSQPRLRMTVTREDR